MTNKIIIIVFVILGASVAVAAAREVLLNIEITGTITTTSELTLYTLGDPGYIWADVGDPVLSFTIPTIATNSVVLLGGYYLVNTGDTDVTVIYDTEETTQNLPLIVSIVASPAWVNADGTVNEVSEKMIEWYYDKTPYDKIYDEDGTISGYKTASFTLTGGYEWTRGENALEIGISLSTENVDVAQDTPFTLHLSFYSEETS